MARKFASKGATILDALHNQYITRVSVTTSGGKPRCININLGNGTSVEIGDPNGNEALIVEIIDGK